MGSLLAHYTVDLSMAVSPVEAKRGSTSLVHENGEILSMSWSWVGEIRRDTLTIISNVRV
jgi:hypothetical protein